jgi:HSP20 family protein
MAKTKVLNENQEEEIKKENFNLETDSENLNPEVENDNWLEDDYSGQLSVDVYQTDKDIVVKSTIAGVRPEDIDISINGDMLTIKGLRRKDHEVEEDDYFFKECYWGGFSRSIILPVDVKADKIAATLKNGVLTVVLPKTEKKNVKVVRVKEEE